MALTTRAATVIANIKALTQAEMAVASAALFRNPNRLFRQFTATFLAAKIAWRPSTYANLFRTTDGNTIANTHPVAKIFRTNLTSFGQEDADSLVEALYKDKANRNVLWGLRRGNAALANSTAQVPINQPPVVAAS